MMPRRTPANNKRAHLLVLGLVILLVSTATRLGLPSEEWHDLIAMGHLKAGQDEVFLHHLPRRGGRSALVVSLYKPCGGLQSVGAPHR